MRTVNNGSALRTELLRVPSMLEDDISDILKKLAMDAFRELVQRSPTDTGFLRSNWSVKVNSTPLENRLRNRHTERNSVSAPGVPNFVVSGDSIITIYNNTEYALYVEEGTATTRAQPMILPTQRMLESIAARLTLSLSRRVYDV